VKKYYKACLNETIFDEEGETFLRNIMKNRLIEWPLITPHYNVSSTKSLDNLLRFRRVGIKTLFNVQVNSDPKDPKKNIIAVKQPSWFYSIKYYTENERFVEAYKLLIRTVVLFFNPTNTNVDAEIDEMYNMEKKFALMLLTPTEKRKEIYENLKIKELQAEYPGFEWTQFIVDGLFEKKKEELKVNEDEPIIVYHSNYIKKAAQYYSSIIKNEKEKRVLDNLMAWSFVKVFISTLPKKYRDALQDFEKVFISMMMMLMVVVF
jgi:predicted metalloendopeptidase